MSDQKFDTANARNMGKALNQPTLALACDEIDKLYTILDGMRFRLAAAEAVCEVVSSEPFSPFKLGQAFADWRRIKG